MRSCHHWTALVTAAAIAAVPAPVFGQQREVPMQEASANFDLEDVEPFLKSLVSLLEAGFESTEATRLAAAIAKQPVDSEKQYTYTIRFQGESMPLRIVAFMDDVDAPDIAFFAPPALASKIDAALEKYFAEVGK